MMNRIKIIGVILMVLLILGVFLYFKYFFTYEQKNIVQRKLENITGQNLTVTMFSFDGKIIKRWQHVQKITSPRDLRDYSFFYTSDNKYVQIPNSVWYVAEEE